MFRIAELRAVPLGLVLREGRGRRRDFAQAPRALHNAAVWGAEGVEAGISLGRSEWDGDRERGCGAR